MSTHQEILNTLSHRFEQARASGDLLFFPSSVHKHVDHGVEFEIRLCPALQHKPALPTPHFDAKGDSQPDVNKKKPDPFAPPYIPNLKLGDLKDEEDGGEYVVLFNKYSVVPEHILLVTKEYKSQASPLLPSELVQVWKLLVAARNAGRKCFAFYNCGDLSGASQPHKHVQFLPLDDPDGPPVEKVARAVNIEVQDKPFSLSTLPYANHVRRLPSSLASASRDEVEHTLANAFMSLLDLVISTIRHCDGYPSGPPSYNVILTLEHMHLIPRRLENYVLSETGDQLSVNSLGFAGMLLVKSERELEAVEHEGIGNILRGVALESVHDLQIEESMAEPE